MISRIAMPNDSTTECALGNASVFAALGPVIRWPNAVNRFAYSNVKCYLQRDQGENYGNCEKTCG
jgi:hypothetical protein